MSSVLCSWTWAKQPWRLWENWAQCWTGWTVWSRRTFTDLLHFHHFYRVFFLLELSPCHCSTCWNCIFFYAFFYQNGAEIEIFIFLTNIFLYDIWDIVVGSFLLLLLLFLKTLFNSDFFFSFLNKKIIPEINWNKFLFFEKRKQSCKRVKTIVEVR